jgi:hypothetical protein
VEQKKYNIMGKIQENRKFERTEKQDNPTSANIDLNTNKKFDLENETIVEKKKES